MSWVRKCSIKHNRSTMYPFLISSSPIDMYVSLPTSSSHFWALQTLSTSSYSLFYWWANILGFTIEFDLRCEWRTILYLCYRSIKIVARNSPLSIHYASVSQTFGSRGPFHRRSAHTQTAFVKLFTPKSACKWLGETLYLWSKLLSPHFFCTQI
jgi:hypothetical protein